MRWAPATPDVRHSGPVLTGRGFSSVTTKRSLRLRCTLSAAVFGQVAHVRPGAKRCNKTVSAKFASLRGWCRIERERRTVPDLTDDLPDVLKRVQTRPLFVMRLAVRPLQVIGGTPAAFRRVGPVFSGSFAGERLSGEVLDGGADWQVVRGD